ncbi:hypothetical protein [Serratia sp. Se-RSBMAAmG]|uniref:hypothetical protein n=1 Tax=Serratia sp. Se-RSBMAAmG TaxID=3043305 RepID=UPI0024AF2F51|nr:hypothetical protein [Serratia sp. Se-RSBMAAmG]MDI6975926.1 hypothetical protein [Serratia sp. Se-RSBMAAmG]
MWKYISGTEKDFVGSPAWATQRLVTDKGDPQTPQEAFVAWIGDIDGKRMVKDQFSPEREFDGDYGYRNFVRAERVKLNVAEPTFLPVETQEKDRYKKIKEDVSINTAGGKIDYLKGEHVSYGGDITMFGKVWSVISISDNEDYMGFVSPEMLEDI